MPYGITSTGFEIKPQEVIEEEMRDALRTNISPTLNLEETSLLGQYIVSDATQAAQVWEALEVAYSQRDPSQAVDDAQDTVGELRGVPRLPASPSLAYMTITLAAGTYTAGSLVVSKTGSSSTQFSNAAAITTAGATLTDVLFVCTENGPTSAPPGTLVTIANPVVGFSAPTNPAAAVLGTLLETNDEYRLRQQELQQVEGSSSVNAVRADLLDKVPGVDYAQVLENDSSAPVSFGALTLPANSIAPIVDGTFNAEALATQILASKAGGIQSYGTSSQNVTTSSGQTVTIGYTEATPVAIDMQVTYAYLEPAFAGSSEAGDAVKAAIVAAFEEYQDVGFDVYPRRYNTPVFALGADVTVAVTVTARRDADPFAETPVVIDFTERATLVIADISVTASAVDAVP
jgi:hypothetical protein